MWFIIEILSFYGYILAAILFILENQISSEIESWNLNPDAWWVRLFGLNFRMFDKKNITDRYKTDFINYHRQEINWFAFILILVIVNAGLISIESFIVFAESGSAGTLRPVMYQLLVNHTLHLVFKRHFLGPDRKISKGGMWIWWFNLVSYSYIFYVYFFTDAKENSQSDYSKCWIPLDCILMALVAMYYFSSKAIEKF